MRCEWHNGYVEATWWADTIHGPLSWCCDFHLGKFGKKDESGVFIAVPAAEKLAELHPTQPSTCGWDKK